MLYDTKNSYLLILEPHTIFIACVKCTTSEKSIDKVISLYKKYSTLVEASFGNLD